MLAFCFFAGLTAIFQVQTPPSLPNSEQALEGWIALWDGTVKDWREGPGWTKSSENHLVVGKGPGGPCCPLGSGEWKFTLKATSLPNATLEAKWMRDGKYEALGNWNPKVGNIFTFQTKGTKAGKLTLEGVGVEIVSAMHKPTRALELVEGKGLNGWKLVPGKKSKATLTDEGWIRIEDGPGDLQTEATFGDFVAQLTLRTGGRHLNSGFFFRSLAGEQWQGYEAQIRNEFTPGTERPYLVETFDPISHEPRGKVEIKSTAVDFGSGAIYRRMPARSNSARDNTWFTLTVAAVGRDISTWVQGQPQVVWTDNRNTNQNARQGFRAKPGVFGIQGHDPTTLIDIRSLRVLPLD